MNEIVMDSDNVLVGFWAYLILFDKSYSEISIIKEKIQILVKKNITQFIQELTNWLKTKTDYAIVCKKQNMYLLNDNRTKKITISLQIANNKMKPIIDLYNNISFELIPYVTIIKNKQNYKIGNLLVLSRYFMIDLWIISVLYNLNILNKEISNKKIRYIVFILNIIRNNKKYINDIFSLDFEGDYINEKVCKKINKINDKIIYPYFPALKH